MATATEAKPAQGSADLRKLLQVKPPSEVVEFLNLLIYGEFGSGKTWLAGSAEDSELTSPVLFLDAEGGVTTIRKRKNIDVVPVRSITQIEAIHDKLYYSIEDGRIYYKTVVIDSVSELADLDMRSIMKAAYDKNPDRVEIDVPSPREWGINRSHIRKIVRGFKDLPCHVIFTASLGVTQEEGQPTKFHPGFSGKLAREVPGFCDIVGYLYPEASVEGVINRKLQVQGSRRVAAKDRTSSLGSVLIDTTIPEIWSLIHNTKTEAKAATK